MLLYLLNLQQICIPSMPIFAPTPKQNKNYFKILSTDWFRSWRRRIEVYRPKNLIVYCQIAVKHSIMCWNITIAALSSIHSSDSTLRKISIRPAKYREKLSIHNAAIAQKTEESNLTDINLAAGIAANSTEMSQSTRKISALTLMQNTAKIKYWKESNLRWNWPQLTAERKAQR